MTNARGVSVSRLVVGAGALQQAQDQVQGDKVEEANSIATGTFGNPLRSFIRQATD